MLQQDLQLKQKSTREISFGQENAKKLPGVDPVKSNVQPSPELHDDLTHGFMTEEALLPLCLNEMFGPNPPGGSLKPALGGAWVVFAPKTQVQDLNGHRNNFISSVCWPKWTFKFATSSLFFLAESGPKGVSSSKLNEKKVTETAVARAFTNIFLCRHVHLVAGMTWWMSVHLVMTFSTHALDVHSRTTAPHC